eukprot:s6127_g8.t2
MCGPSMRVLVAYVSGAEVAEVELEREALVEAVHRAVTKATGIPGTRQQLLRGHELLWPTMRLSQLGDEDELFLSLVVHRASFVATASDDGTARIWHTHRGNCATRMQLQKRFSNSRIWHASQHKLALFEVHTLEGHGDVVRSAVFSPDGYFVLTATSAGNAKIWNVLTGQCVRALPVQTYALSLAVFNADSSLVLTAAIDGTAKIWRVPCGGCFQTLRGHQGTVTSAEFSKDGTQVLTGSWDKTAKIWLVAPTSREQNRAEDCRADLGSCLGCVGFFLKSWCQTRNDRLCLRTLRGHSHAVLSAAYAPDGDAVLTASVDGTARIWRGGETIQILEGHGLGVFSAVFSVDSRLILTASWDRTAKIWEVASGTCLRTLKGHGLPVRSAVFSADDAAVLTASDDGSAKIWSVKTGTCLRTLVRPGHFVRVALFSPDATLVLTSFEDGTAQLWDPCTGDCLQTLSGHDQSVKFARFSP